MFCSCKSGENNRGEKKLINEKRILLLGTGESGKTTIIKQMKILHLNGFSDSERKEKIPKILENIHESIFSIVDSMEKIDPPIDIELEENRKSIKLILNFHDTLPQFDEEYFGHVKNLWTDKGVQAAFKRSNEYQLIDSAEHFLNRLDVIQQKDYIPSVEDMLYCRVTTTAISEIKFSVSLSRISGGQANFVMIDVGGQRGHRRKWIQVFDGIEAVLFLIAASDFDLKLREDDTKNRLDEAFHLFGDMCGSPFLEDAAFIVFLNKQDLLRKKVEVEGRKIEEYFKDYKDYKKNKLDDKKQDHSEYEIVRDYMHDTIKDISRHQTSLNKKDSIFNMFVSNENIENVAEPPPKDVFVHFTIATDTNNIRRVFKSIQEKIINMVIRDTFSL